MAGRVALARLLLQNGAQIDKRDIWEVTPLYMAMESGNWRTSVLLVLEGAKIADEHCPLHSFLEASASEGNEVAVKRLIAAGAEVQRKNYRGRTPYMIAKDKGHEKVANILLEKTRSPLPSPKPSPELRERDFAGTSGGRNAVHITVSEHGHGDQMAELMDREGSSYGIALDRSLEPKKAWRRERSQSMRKEMQEMKREVEGSLKTNLSQRRDFAKTEKTNTDVEEVRMLNKKTSEKQETRKVTRGTDLNSNADPEKVETSCVDCVDCVALDKNALMILAALTLIAVTTLLGGYAHGQSSMI